MSPSPAWLQPHKRAGPVPGNGRQQRTAKTSHLPATEYVKTIKAVRADADIQRNQTSFPPTRSADSFPINPTHSAPAAGRNQRVLVIDDNVAIHDDVRKILCPQQTATADALASLEAELLDASPAPHRQVPGFAVDSAHQGQEGLELVKRAAAEGRPYAVAFVDVRMPPGWDGIETTLELWKIAPDLQVVICTAYSDYSWEEMLARIGGGDRLVVLKKPFDTIEVLQLANTLTEKWNLLQQTRAHAGLLEQRVSERTADLKAANAALHAEIARRARVETDLQHAKEAAESADRAKTAFLANMSHEIRTPMNGIMGVANLLLLTELNAEQRELTTILTRSSEGLLSIINDILDFSKIEAGHMTLEAIDFNLLEHLFTAVELHNPALEQKGLELVVNVDAGVPALLNGDPMRLRQIILNLLGNAVKFTAHGEVVITLTCSIGPAGRLILRCEVHDTGIGVSPAVQATLFRPFVQADDSTTRKYGGSGLGLAICRRLVQLMHGEIGVISEPGKGSTFWFTAEVGKANFTTQEHAPVHLPFAGRRVLVVDDNATSARLLERLLRGWGALPRIAASADAALAALRSCSDAAPYELVLLDHRLPGTTGPALAAAIRDGCTHARPALLLLTSRSERPIQTDLPALGFDACELKPVHAGKLLQTIARVLGEQPASAATEASALTKAAG